MTSFRHITLSVGVTLGLAFVLAGCHGAADMPLAPSGAQGGATIQGTVEGTGAPSAAARAASAASKIRVSALGTGLSTGTDSSGHFVLAGLPGGNLSLRFEGPGIDATLDIGGLAEGRVLTIRVDLSGSQATLVSPNSGPRTEIRGSIESITPPLLRVGGRTVVTDANTEFKGPLRFLADLRVGDRIKVEGRAMPTGNVLAQEIKRLGGDAGDAGDAGTEVELEGSIESITPPTLRVAGRTVLTDGNTRIERDDRRVGLAELKVGETAKVEGVTLADRSVRAGKIEVGNGGGDDEDEGDRDDGGNDDREE